MYASSFGNLSIVEALLKKNAKMNLHKEVNNMHTQTQFVCVPISVAINAVRIGLSNSLTTILFRMGILH